MNGHRRSERYPFVATANITDHSTGSIITARLGDLSLQGCYIQMTSPLMKGTEITIHVSVGTSLFQAVGRVVNRQPNRGVGVEFEKVEPPSQAVLEAWLLEAKSMYPSEGAK